MSRKTQDSPYIMLPAGDGAVTRINDLARPSNVDAPPVHSQLNFLFPSLGLAGGN
jgi:hypothetical protein